MVTKFWQNNWLYICIFLALVQNRPSFIPGFQARTAPVLICQFSIKGFANRQIILYRVTPKGTAGHTLTSWMLSSKATKHTSWVVLKPGEYWMHFPRWTLCPSLGKVNESKCFQVAQAGHSWEMLFCQKGIWIKPNPFQSAPLEPHSPKLCTISYWPTKLSPVLEVQSSSHNTTYSQLEVKMVRESVLLISYTFFFIFVPILDSLSNEEYSLKHLCTVLVEIKKSKLAPSCNFSPSGNFSLSQSQVKLQKFSPNCTSVKGWELFGQVH